MFHEAVIIINHLPTAPLNFQIPIQLLYNSVLAFDSFRVFGYTCFPWLRPYAKYKLNYHSKQCVYLGQSAFHKVYLCLDKESDKIYMSRHVVFDEMTFPFHKICPSLPTTTFPIIAVLPTSIPSSLTMSTTDSI